MSKVAEIFSKRSLRPLHELPRALTPAMKAARSAEDDERPRPLRRFVVLSNIEQAEHASVPWPMLVETRVAGNLYRVLWNAPNKATWLATNHNDPAPADQELLAAGWRRAGGAPIENGATE
jgi:hypothetical protein